MSLSTLAVGTCIALLVIGGTSPTLRAKVCRTHPVQVRHSHHLVPSHSLSASAKKVPRGIFDFG